MQLGRKAKITIVTGVVVVLLGAGAAYAYDSSQKDEIAEGVTIGGVDVGGMDAEQAQRAVRAQLLAPLSHSLRSPTTARAGGWTATGSRFTPTSRRRLSRPSTRAATGASPGAWCAT